MELYSIALAIFIAFSLSLSIFFLFRSSRHRHRHPHLALPPVPPPPSDLSTTYPETYDVFLSYRGEDTRNNFTSHLYEALCSKQIETFVDDEELHRGVEISPSLLKAIEQSKLSVIIFSKDYASSEWCLDELVKILESKEKNGQIVIPVFYHVDPSEVRKQCGSYALFPKHWQLLFQGKMDKLQKWKAALTEAATISGLYSTNIESEANFNYKLVKRVVQDILLKLNRLRQNEINFEGLVGIEEHIEKIESLLQIGSSKVRTVGIWGMGGIGKTTISQALLAKLSYQFDTYCFVPIVRELAEKFGLHSIRDKYLSDLLDQENLYTGTHGITSKFVKERLSRRNALVVFDDVNKSTQLEYFLETIGVGYLGSGSRIMITSADRQVLSMAADEIYEVPKMQFRESLCLFSLHAFRENNPVKDFKKLSKSMVNYCDGNPLALKVLGSFLCGRSKEEWRSALKNLKVALHVDIQVALESSYNGLDHKEKEVFLDIACFFDNHEDKTNIIEILGGSAIMIMRTLSDLSLIYTSSADSKVEMHNLLRLMGQEIIRQESPNPGKRSRLWHPQEINHVLRNNTGTDAIECIFLDMSKIKEIHVTASAFANMPNLRILKFYDSIENNGACYKSKVLISEDLESVFHKLRYFEWVGYPWKSLPLDSSLETLAELISPNSQVEQLWDGVQYLPNLRAINLSYSKHLTTFPDLAQAPNLKYVNLSGCHKLSKFPRTSTNIVELNLTNTAIQEVPSSVGSLAKLSKLDLSYCQSLQKLPSIICELKSRLNLVLSGCRGLKKFPKITKPVKNLWALSIDRTSITKLPSHLEHLIGLEHLNFSDCEDLTIIPDSISKLNCLNRLSISRCPRIKRFPLISGGLRSLERLWMDDCSSLLKIPSDIGCLSSLKELSLHGSNIERLPASIKGLTNLGKLDLSDSKMLKSLPELPPSLRYLDACGCSLLEMVSSTRKIISSKYEKKLITDMTADFIMDFTNCLKLTRDAYDNIMEDARVGLHYCLNKMLRFEGIFPGSEIPEGFPYQSEGPSLTIKRIPPIWGNAKSWGFVACAIFEVNDTTPLDKFDHMCEIKCENEGDHFLRSFPLFGGFFPKSCSDRFFEKDHAVISCYWESKGYSAPAYNSDGYQNVTFTIVPNSDRNHYKCDRHPHYNFKVKKVGIYLTFSPKKEENGDEEDEKNNGEEEEDYEEDEEEEEGKEEEEKGNEEDKENNREEEDDNKGEEEEKEEEEEEEGKEEEEEDNEEGEDYEKVKGEEDDERKEEEKKE